MVVATKDTGASRCRVSHARDPSVPATGNVNAVMFRRLRPRMPVQGYGTGLLHGAGEVMTCGLTAGYSIQPACSRGVTGDLLLALLCQ